RVGARGFWTQNEQSQELALVSQRVCRFASQELELALARIQVPVSSSGQEVPPPDRLDKRATRRQFRQRRRGSKRFHEAEQRWRAFAEIDRAARYAEHLGRGLK